MDRVEREPTYDVAQLSRDFEETSVVSDYKSLFLALYQLSPKTQQQQQQPMNPEEAALTDREQLETELIRRLISSYFNIVRETIADQVPKAIMHLLVNHSKDAVQNRLVTELYREDFFNDLLYEDDNIKAEREKCERLLETYRQAARIVNDVV
jgi:dynamin 1-like protein